MKNVLVFSCGALTAIDINFALRGNAEYKVYGASSYDDHGRYVYQNYIGEVPFIYEKDFIPKFNAILNKYEIDFIIPLHEDMILFFQQHIEEIHATVVSSCYETALLCRYKTKTYKALSEYDFVPRVYKADEVTSFPVFVKKDNDQGARHAYKVENAEALILYAGKPDMVICEYLPGEEVTVDCFTDRHGVLRLVNPRAADRILAGIDVHARRLPFDSEIQRIAECINSRISFRGPWFFQIKRAANEKFKLLEISTRFAGAFSLTRCMDLNTPLLALRDFDNKELEFSFNDCPIEADKMFIGRYTIACSYDKVIIDGFDCICADGKVDTFFMMYLYQCVNMGKPIIMICDDEQLMRNHLKSVHIDIGLFKYISNEHIFRNCNFRDLVFISKNENRRASVRTKYSILCYEPTAIEALLDWHG